jgi:uracil-DNA glycosylase
MTYILKDEKWSWKTHSLKNFIEEGNIEESWIDFFKEQDYLIESISDSLESETKHKTIYPELYNVFRTFFLPLNKIRVVILGLDPYHNSNATGLCFSVPKGGKINPSLRNIYKQLKLEGFTPDESGCLNHWLEQGCFMLNTALTVEKGKPESHIKIWKEFSINLIKHICKNTKGVVWLLMGSKAISFSEFIKEKEKNILCVSHPSPFSCFRKAGEHPSFMNSGVFTKINNFLEKNIKW